MDLSPEQIEAIEEKLSRLSELDPTQLPGPAAELVELLNDILEETESR